MVSLNILKLKDQMRLHGIYCVKDSNFLVYCNQSTCVCMFIPTIQQVPVLYIRVV